MGQFNIGDENNRTKLINSTTDWKNDGSSLIALVEGVQLTTPDGVTLAFKQGAILSVISRNDTFICNYNDNDLR